MKMKKILLLTLTSFTLLFAEESVSAKVVYDLTTKNIPSFEMRILSAIAANKTHYEKSLRELDVTVVIHGGAYRFFTISPSKTDYKDDTALIKAHANIAKRLKTMVDTYDVEFVMCGAGMPKHNLQAKDIFKFVTIIPNSTIGLIDRQNEGYAYIPVGD